MNLCNLWIGAEGEIRTLETRLEVSHVSSYITPAKSLVGEDRVELSPRVPKTRMLTLHHTPILNFEERLEGPREGQASALYLELCSLLQSAKYQVQS